ncbi:T9SS type A sorting domain-containing protein [Ekhidna sp.]|uniref:T9SS type A sorting domain-containing protein n=1 Tax=Ekhidna sp. TaxID=2608089 RepID=UPI003C7A2E77
MRYLISLLTVTLSVSIFSQSIDVVGPKPFSDILQQSFTTTWTPAAISGIENRSYIILLDEATKQSAVVLDDADISQLNIEEVSGVTGGTYSSMLRSIFQLVDINTNTTDALTGKYTIHPLLQSYHGLNTSDGANVNVSDAGSYYLDSGDGYLIVEFEGTASSTTVAVTAQYEYNTTSGEFEENTSWTTKWLMISGDQLSLTANSGNATSFFLADPHDLIDFSLQIGSDFNPKGTEWQENAFAAYPDEVWTYGASALFGDQFFEEIDDAYETQFGNDDAANTAASNALDQIESDLSTDGESLRYDKSVYLEFRDNLLSRTFGAADMYNSLIGENTVSYVYFTNASDDEGVRHPFMVIASHNASDSPNFLIDVARPPGDGNGAGYEEQSVTRNAVLEVKLIKIPLKDYGLIENLEDNDLSADGTLAEDLGLTSADFDVYNYAARASNGIAIDGVVIYPSHNNNLRFAAMDAEISSTGIHVGQGMGLHYHADGHGFTGNGLNLYNESDYEGVNHPPIIGFAYDGVALFGKYESDYSSMEGYGDALDEFGGHDHSEFGYHYHAFGEEVTVEDDMEGTIGPFVQHFLLVGAWKGNINEIPGIFEGSTAQLKDEEVGRFAGASYEEGNGGGTTLGVNKNEDWVVYPNPSKGTFKIITEGLKYITLMDLSGRMKAVREIDATSTVIFDGVESGVYILRGQGSKGQYEKRIVIE